MTEESIVYLKDNITGELVQATLVEKLQIREIVLTEELQWKPVIQECFERLTKAGVPKEQWPQHTGWSWRRKHKKYSRSLAYKFFGIRCDGKLQGLMLLSMIVQKGRSKDHEGKPILYIQYIETAPWNYPVFVQEPKYSLVGTNFIDIAIKVSVDEECEGRIALHSLPQSDDFYVKCGMTDLGPDPDFDNLRYFEMTKEQAQAFISEES
jgi:hypothetical protein